MKLKKKAAAVRSNRTAAAFAGKIPAITDFRAKGTIMGLTGLTAVFGMGTGVAPPVWSPESGREGDDPSRPQWVIAAQICWHIRPCVDPWIFRDRHAVAWESGPVRLAQRRR